MTYMNHIGKIKLPPRLIRRALLNICKGDEAAGLYDFREALPKHVDGPKIQHKIGYRAYVLVLYNRTFRFKMSRRDYALIAGNVFSFEGSKIVHETLGKGRLIGLIWDLRANYSPTTLLAEMKHFVYKKLSRYPC